MGLVDGLCFATEHQGNDTPHAHGLYSPATLYRNKTLEDIKHLITEKLCTPDAIKRYVSHMCRKQHFDLEKHTAELPALEKIGLNNRQVRHTSVSASDPCGKRRMLRGPRPQMPKRK